MYAYSALKGTLGASKNLVPSSATYKNTGRLMQTQTRKLGSSPGGPSSEKGHQLASCQALWEEVSVLLLRGRVEWLPNAGEIEQTLGQDSNHRAVDQVESERVLSQILGFR